jgi:flagellum-specific ATP synthase
MNKERLQTQIQDFPIFEASGRIIQSVGTMLEARIPFARLGARCKILKSVDQPVQTGRDAEVVGFKKDVALLMAYEDSLGLSQESVAVLTQPSSLATVGSFLLGRVINAKGEPLDSKGPFEFQLVAQNMGIYTSRELYRLPSHPIGRARITESLDLGVRALNGLVTCGRGQRIGIMAGSGVGKSMLLGMISRFTDADINVIALVGERGREVGEFLDRDLGPEVLKRSVVVVATSDQSALLRTRAAFLATTIAEYFRDQKKHVLLMMDSVTRFCMAQREIGLAVGEPPASKGYTPGVFAMIPKLLERAGTGIAGGSITGIYSVLVDGDDLDEPIADATRGILDGHVVLSRKLAQRGHFPAIDILQSTSRVMHQVVSLEHKALAAQLREWLAIYTQMEDLIQIGAYVKGSHPKTDQAIAIYDQLEGFLRQGFDARCSMQDTLLQMLAIVRKA